MKKRDNRAAKVRLPSGRVVALMKIPQPEVPWELDGFEGCYRLLRAKRGDTSQREVFKGNTTLGAIFDEGDALALMKILNDARLYFELKSRALASADLTVDFDNDCRQRSTEQIEEAR